MPTTRSEPVPTSANLAGRDGDFPGAAGPDPFEGVFRGQRNADAGGGGPAAPRRARRGDLSQLLALIADRTRMRIIHILATGERPVIALTSELRLPQPTVSHHLAWLKTLDLVTPRRQGKHIYYCLGPAVQWDTGILTFTAGDATVTVTPR